MGFGNKEADGGLGDVSQLGQGDYIGEVVLSVARDMNGALCPDSTNVIPVERQTLTQKLLAAPVELEVEFTREINKLLAIKDQLPYHLKSLLETFLPKGECDGSIYYSGFLDTLEIVLDSLGDNHLIDGICWIMSEIRSFKKDIPEEVPYKKLYKPGTCTGCGVPIELGCECIPF